MADEETIIGFIEICASPRRRLDIAVADLDEEHRGVILAALGAGEEHTIVGEHGSEQFHYPSTGYWLMMLAPPYCPGCGQKQEVNPDG